jgi:hypothetical protein
MPLLTCLLLAAAGCNINSVHEERPARIVNPTGESRAELKRVVSDMLFGADILLADDALTDSSVLVVDRNRVRSVDNPPLSGRDLGRPERFQLVTTGTKCVLIHENDQARYELPGTECVAE